jgi:hypothetical protein
MAVEAPARYREMGVRMRNEYNVAIASRLDEVANLLEEQGANPYRVRAYRRAAERIRVLDDPMADIVRTGGLEDLMRLPGIGESIARSIRLLVVLGRLPMLERLRGKSDPEAVLRSVPGIGRTLAGRVHDELGIASLAQLEAAAHDGRLRDIAGVGEKRLAGIRDVLASRLRRVREPETTGAVHEPAVADLLDVDREYRDKAAAGTLTRIAPRRFNPTGRRGSPSCIHGVAIETTARCFPTRRGHTGGARPAIGSCSTTMTAPISPP